MAGYTSLENSAGRLINTPVFTDRATSDFDSSVRGGKIARGYDFRVAGLLLGPVASVEYLRFDQDGFSEDGAMQLTSSFVDYPPETFTVTSAEPVGNETLASLGLTVEYGPNLSLYLDFLASLTDGQDARLLSGSFSWQF
jgi:uncharacterized protein with beta-barrel porin domain